MALVFGTNCGFVSVRPTSDPATVDSSACDGYHLALKHTSPSGSYILTEIGVYLSGVYTGGTYKVSLYSDNAGVPGTEQAGFPLATQSTTTDAGQWYIYSGLSFALVSNTVYWMSTGHVDVAGGPRIDQDRAAGSNVCYALYANKPSINLNYTSMSIYALYQAVSTGHPAIKRFGGVPFAAINRGVW